MVRPGNVTESRMLVPQYGVCRFKVGSPPRYGKGMGSQGQSDDLPTAGSVSGGDRDTRERLVRREHLHA